MPGVDPNDVIWIQTAAKDYPRSRKWLDEQIAERHLSVIKVPGDVKVYLLRSEIEALLKYQITQPREENAG